MGMTPEQERKKADALAYIEFMRKSDELLKDIGSVSYGGAEQILNQLNSYKDKYGHALTTGRLDTAISEWSAIAQDKRERYERTADIRNAYNNQIASIDANLKRNEDMIAGQREGAIKQAYSNYDRSKSTYGQNAEKLARMGLGNSGYSDYLTGVAYGNMVGGIENANVTAKEALEKAYYNADQQKLQAAAERDTAIANVEKAYGEKEAALIAAINSGEIDLEGATAMANAYDLTSGTIANLEKVAKAYEDKVNTENTNNAIKNLDTYFGGNYTDENGNPIIYTEQQIRDLAKTAGYDETKIEQLVKDNNTKVVNLYSSAITSETTDDEINLFGLSPEATTELKAIRDNAKYTELVQTTLNGIKADQTTANIVGADTLISEGKVEEGQALYFENDLLLVQNIGKDGLTEEEVKKTLEKHNRDGRLSDADYGNLLTYLEAKTKGGVVDADKTRNRWLDNFIRDMGAAYAYSQSSQSYNVPSTSTDTGVAVRIDGERYKVSTYETAENAEKSKQLDAVAGTTGNIVKEGDTYYIKSNGEWRKVKDKASNAKFYAAMDIKVSQNSFVTPPKHTVSTTTP